MRLKPTLAEQALLVYLHSIKEYPVIPQLVVFDCIIDIALPSRDLLIELDGSIHKTFPSAQYRDKYKTELLLSHGFNLVRIENEDASNFQYILDILNHYPPTNKQAFLSRLKKCKAIREQMLMDAMKDACQYNPDHIAYKFMQIAVKAYCKRLANVA